MGSSALWGAPEFDTEAVGVSVGAAAGLAMVRYRLLRDSSLFDAVAIRPWSLRSILLAARSRPARRTRATAKIHRLWVDCILALPARSLARVVRGRGGRSGFTAARVVVRPRLHGNFFFPGEVYASAGAAGRAGGAGRERGFQRYVKRKLCTRIVKQRGEVFRYGVI